MMYNILVLYKGAFLMKYFLASASPRRRELLKYLIDDFIAESTDIDEQLNDNDDIEPQLMSLAYQKAFTLGKRLGEKNEIEKGDIIIGSDTIVYLDGILEKPKDKEDAASMLRKLSGKMHSVYTAIAVIKSGDNLVLLDINKTDVYFRELTTSEIYEYIETGEPLDKAGSYAIQGKGARFIEKIEGDFYSVMGLPINILDKMLREMI